MIKTVTEIQKKSYFLVSNVRLNSTQYLIMKIPNKREIRNIAINQ